LAPVPVDPEELRLFREGTLYRLLIRARRTENDEMLRQLWERGYTDLQSSYPGLLANLDPGGTSITTLAARAGVTRQAASQRIGEIESRGYVSREPDPNDARAVVVRRTAKGERLLRDALEVVSGLEAGYAKVLGRKRYEQMHALLAELVDEIDPIGALRPD